jgi:phage-related minor tail protein
MAAAIIKELYNVLVVQQLVGSFDRATGQGAGLVGMIGSALFRADGGPVSAGQPNIVGERGPEMIIPKSSGMVLTNGQTKAALGGSSNESYVVNNNISVTGSDSAMVRQEIAKMIPQISSATKAAMIDAKRRGGQMGNAFR